MGSKIMYLYNKAHVCAVFEKKESMAQACEIQLFEENNFILTPMQNRGDEEVRERTVMVRDLPLNVDRHILKSVMEDAGEIEDIKLQISGLWYKAYVTYKNKQIVENEFKSKQIWRLFYLKDLCRVAPATVTKTEIDARNEFTLKLTNLPFGTTAYDLKELLKKVDAKTCFIPRTRNQYGRARYAFVTFADYTQFNKIHHNTMVGHVGEHIMEWVDPDVKTCHKCGDFRHLVIDCEEKVENDRFKERRRGYNKVYSRYHIPNYKKMGNESRNTDNKQPGNNVNQNTRSNDINKLLLETMKGIQVNIKEVNNTLLYLNQRITKIEKQVGIKTPAREDIAITLNEKSKGKENLKLFNNKTNLINNLFNLFY